MNKNEIVVDVLMQHDKLIYSIINNFSKYYDKEDLYQVGVIGLIKAFNNFDNTLGAKFSTYAYSYILGEVKAYIRSDKQIKVSRDILRVNTKIEQAKAIMSQKLMREPSVLELSLFLELDEQKIEEALNVNNIISFDEPINEDGKEITLYDTISKKENVDINTLIDLREQLSNLSSDERILIESRYFKDNTQTETANMLGMSQVQVSRCEQKVLTKLRQRL